jgi:hypothetical protein
LQGSFTVLLGRMWLYTVVLLGWVTTYKWICHDCLTDSTISHNHPTSTYSLQTWPLQVKQKKRTFYRISWIWNASFVKNTPADTHPNHIFTTYTFVFFPFKFPCLRFFKILSLSSVWFLFHNLELLIECGKNQVKEI